MVPRARVGQVEARASAALLACASLEAVERLAGRFVRVGRRAVAAVLAAAIALAVVAALSRPPAEPPAAPPAEPKRPDAASWIAYRPPERPLDPGPSDRPADGARAEADAAPPPDLSRPSRKPLWPEEGPGLRGRLRLPAAMQVEAVEVRVLPDVGEEIPFTRLVLEGARATARRADEYEFWIPDLREGTCRVAVRAGGRAPFTDAGAVEVPPPPRRALIRVALPPSTPILTVRAEGPDGKPVRSFTVLAQYVEREATLAHAASQGPAGEGERTVMFRRPRGGGLGLPEFDPLRGRMHVHVRSPLGALRTEVEPGEAMRAEVRFREPGSLRVLVEPPEGFARWKDLRISLAEAGPPGRVLAIQDENRRTPGEAEFAAVQPGECAVVLRLGVGDTAWDVLRVPAAVRSGETTHVRCSLPTLHAVAYRNAPRGFFLHRLDDPRWRVTVMPATAPLTLDGLPEGRYRVTGDREERSFEFALPGYEDIDMASHR